VGDATETNRMRRVTIRDIASQAGVSKGAVSYALNGRPGVSAETRERIVSIARELGWYPNRAARALSAARADAFGLVLARPATTIALEPFFMQFLAGVERELSDRSIGLTIQLAPTVEDEIAVYRRWYGEHRVDGVFLFDPRHDDPRFDALIELDLPTVVIGGPLGHARLPSVWHEEAPVVDEAVRYLATLGHRRIAYVAGVAEFVHSERRAGAFHDAARETNVQAEVVWTDYTPTVGARETRRLLTGPEPPTAILFDSDLLAVTGLGVAHRMGLTVPGDLSIIGWDDSLISQVVHPPLTAITRDIVGYGMTTARHLVQVADGTAEGDVEVARGELTLRGSVAPPREARPR
jgi:DNA-binding LacI/PurR family transcriptional regulator